MNGIAVWRINLLRICYLLLAVGLGLMIWPAILSDQTVWKHAQSVVVAMLGALGLVAVLGLRYPLQMLPLLFFEMAWKAIWLVRVALPSWQSGKLDAAMAQTAYECSFVAIFLVLIPWDYVVRAYVLAKGDPWFRRPNRTTAG